MQNVWGNSTLPCLVWLFSQSQMTDVVPKWEQWIFKYFNYNNHNQRYQTAVRRCQCKCMVQWHLVVRQQPTEHPCPHLTGSYSKVIKHNDSWLQVQWKKMVMWVTGVSTLLGSVRCNCSKAFTINFLCHAVQIVVFLHTSVVIKTT